MLLCHGFGAPGDDLVSLADIGGEGIEWFFPEAPLTIDFGFGEIGRAWWPIDMVRMQDALLRGELDMLMREDPPGLDEARVALGACIDVLVRDHGVARDRLVIGGFSQGAMLATDYVLREKASFAGLVLLSGAPVRLEQWSELAKSRAPGLRVFQAHGVADSILPFAAGEALRDLLETSGARLEWHPHPGEHEIPLSVLEAFGSFLRATFDEQKTAER